MPPSVPRGGGVPSAGARGARISPSNAGLIALGIMSICVLGHKVLLHQEQVEADRWQAFQERVVRKVDRSVDKLIRSQERLDTRIAKLSAHVDAVRVAGAGAAAGDRDAPARGHRKLRRGKGRRAGGTDDDDEDGGGAVEAGRAGAAASCGEGHRPFHTLLTAQSSVYQQWQSRIM